MHRFRVQGARIRVGGIYSTLKLKNAALSSEVNSRQILPSTTEADSGVIAYLIRPQ